MAEKYIIRLTNKMLEARRNGDLVEAEKISQEIGKLQYIW